MRLAHKGLFLSAIPLLLLSAAALGGLNGVDVTISNDGTEDMMVTVYDTSTQPASVVISGERVNGFTRIPVSLAPDENGLGNIAWTAVSTDPNHRKCGHAAQQGVSDSTAVHVRVDSECGHG
ncbi:MAG TPA: hypothetical protein VHY75_00395 [Steroidobacteraceae bacterium]|jgi:hypothetical protein|nr:hypothetical protein [Steroidobacteraceae bacterium]